MGERAWDVVVAGAGIGGAVCAAMLAERGLRVLLAERSRFPRAKVCGGCLNSHAIEQLVQAGLDPTPMGLATSDRLCVARRSRRAHASVAPGLVIERASFDAWLVERAIARGVVFEESCSVRVLGTDDNGVELSIGDARTTASWLVDATGLTGLTEIYGDASASTPANTGGWRIDSSSRFGVGAIAPASVVDVDRGEIAMHVGNAGYVGLARLADGRINIAAALHPLRARASGGPSGVCADILRSCGASALWDELDGLGWKGTPLLSRSRPATGGQRTLRIGDAGGYVEPFTGEGMGWAIQDALAAATLLGASSNVPEAAVRRSFESWSRTARKRRTRRCRAVRAVARSPRLTDLSIVLLGVRPAARVMVASSSRPPRLAGLPS